LIIAEKGISVTNVANGTTRLQPVVLLTGQAAGTLAALSTAKAVQPKDVPIRLVQQSLLESKAYLMPYMDVKPDNPHFESVQKIGATGILRGKGIPFNWANQTWFYPDSLVNAEQFSKDLNEFKKGNYKAMGGYLTLNDAVKVLTGISSTWFKNAAGKSYASPLRFIEDKWQVWGLQNFNPSRNITRAELAVLLNKTVDPFWMKAVNHKGAFTQ
jgi:hypothetical protein